MIDKIFSLKKEKDVKMIDSKKFDHLEILLGKLDQEIEFWHVSNNNKPITNDNLVHYIVRQKED